MKKILLILTLCFIICSCADDKTFTDQNGKTFVAESYGWADYNTKKIEGVEYNVSVGNVIWSIILFETIIAPVYLTGYSLYEPVSYNHPDTSLLKK